MELRDIVVVCVRGAVLVEEHEEGSVCVYRHVYGGYADVKD